MSFTPLSANINPSIILTQVEQLKHECGIALIRLRKPLQYYKEKYGTYTWGLDKLYLLMEKQHNRGQEAAGVGVVKLDSPAGHEYIFRERALGTDAIQTIFAGIHANLTPEALDRPAADIEAYVPFLGQIYMGHLRYSTTGRSGMGYVHPFLRRNNWRARNLMLCGNFNMTNVDSIFQSILAQGQHPRFYSDTTILLEQIGYALDKENHRLYRDFRSRFTEPQLSQAIEDNIDMMRVLKSTAHEWDGGFVICGATGSGDMFALRDRHGIRPAFYYVDDEVIVVASERPVIQTALNVPRASVNELEPGHAVIIGKYGQLAVRRILPEAPQHKCSFERIYFSRGSDADIYRERKALGAALAPELARRIGYDFDHTVFSFIPNTAEVAHLGLIQGLEDILSERSRNELKEKCITGTLTPDLVETITGRRVRNEKLVIKDIKLRTFIAEGDSRDDLAAHVYDVTYGIVHNDVDTLVAIDDSIVRGTTLRQSILRILDRLHPKRIIIVSSSPQVRYPDCYGIDMSRMAEFCAFRAAVALLKETGRTDILDKTYRDCIAQLELAPECQINAVKQIYEPFTQRQISEKIAEMLTPPGIKAEVEILYQSIEGLHQAVPNHTGDWYFTGDYPTPGGTALVNRAYVNFYKGNTSAR